MRAEPVSAVKKMDPADDLDSMVYVIDDDEAMRIALVDLLHSIGLGAQAFASCREFSACHKEDVPSCLILDVRLHGETGLAFQDELVKTGIRMPIIFMTGYGDVAMSVKAMKAGAVDFLPKPFREQDMLDAVTNALTCDSERLAAQRALAALRASYASLSPREQQVMLYVVDGLMNKEIASELNLSEITVKIHRAQVMRKMAARSVADLVRMTAALGIETPKGKPAWETWDAQENY
ncbi:response regulator transcription factor [Paraburkholderia guartelaensis]|uniref:Response regulator transcription factor n=1 Tax=Paraburkholderia guartelaensis TaxID=2546446 RepID=A0A4R5LAK6_9BURK|nr:response regulator [Paraburkholderia guartelaensis]TDG04952.1 response regulator transcription factor [Paraburkholderia guartelaensis]